MLVHGFSLPFYKLLQEMPMCGVFLIMRDFHITIKEDEKLTGVIHLLHQT
jgi:hypothetical protein